MENIGPVTKPKLKEYQNKYLFKKLSQDIQCCNLNYMCGGVFIHN